MAVFESYLSRIVLNTGKVKRLKEFIPKLPEEYKDDEKLKQFYDKVETYDRDNFTISFLLLPDRCIHVLLKFMHKLYETDDKKLLDAEEKCLLNTLNSDEEKDNQTETDPMNDVFR